MFTLQIVTGFVLTVLNFNISYLQLLVLNLMMVPQKNGFLISFRTRNITIQIACWKQERFAFRQDFNAE